MGYTDKFTADQWRNGTYLRGETYHTWLTEMVEKCDLDYASLNHFYDEIKQTYCKERGLIPENLHNQDYVAITKRVEEAIEKWNEWKIMKGKKPFWRRLIQPIIRLIR
jgi:hypothetical protein